MSDKPKKMKVRVVKARISKKAYHQPQFPRFTRKGLNNDTTSAKVINAEIERPQTPDTVEKKAAVGYCSLKNLKDIVVNYKDDRELFRKRMNRFINEMTEVVKTSGGNITKFENNGFHFYFFGDKKDISKIITSTINTALKLRYRLNKLNREWKLVRNDLWKTGLGISFGNVYVSTDKSKLGFIEGRVPDFAKNIGNSALPYQIIIPSDILNAGFDESIYNISQSRHITLRNTKDLLKVSEIIDLKR